MKKIFNKKAMIIYSILLSFCFVMGCVMIGFNVHYSNAFEAEMEKGSDSTASAIVNGLSTLLSSLGNSDAASNIDEALNGKEEEMSDAAKALLTKKNTSLAFIVVFFVLTALFMAAAITSSEYEKYLVSDKYKAKLRRLEKAKKANKTI